MSDAVALVVQELMAMPWSDNETRLPGPEPVRLQFAAKDFITRFPPGGPYSLRVETPVERPWKARIEGDQTRATHPGTALLFQGRYYEVVLSEAGGEGLVYYYLSPWQEEFIIRQAAELTPQSSEQAEAEYLAARERRKRGFLLLLASPLLGLLPGRDQVDLENKYGTNALFNTALSAVLIGVPAGLFAVLGIASSIAGGFGGESGFDAQRTLWASSYFLGESAFRIWACLSAGEPAGSLPLVVLTEIVRAVRRLGHRD